MAEIRNILRQALTQHQAGQLQAASSLYQQILNSDPNHAEALHLLGVIAIQTSRPQDAIELIERAVSIRSDQAAWFGNLATAQSAVGDLDAAVATYQTALELDSGYVEGHYNLGHVHGQMGNHAAAEACYREAIALNPAHVGSLNNLGTCLRQQGRSEESIEFLEQLTAGAAGFVEGHYNLANSLRDAERLEQSIGAYRRALEIEPDSPKVLAGLGISLLLSGEFESGWEAYESRLNVEAGAIPHGCAPLWGGDSLAGKTIMLFAEQGFGDTLQFVRYAQAIKEMGATVFLECQPPLKTILASCEYLDGIFKRGEPLPAFDVAAPLLSLPRLLGTRLNNIPAADYLSASPELIDAWTQRLHHIDGLKVGIAWQGAPGHLSDARRSFPLSSLGPVANREDVTLIALQKGHGVEQIGAVDFAVHQLGDDVDETNGAFMDTAAVMKCLDLVITSDTSIAHLAGALCVPVWIALSKGPDWRWLLDRSDSPWYPTAKLFRQSTAGEWSDVFERIATDIGTLGCSSEPITVEVSAGELIDKISILEIKQSRIDDPEKLDNIQRELATLTDSRDRSIQPSETLEKLTGELKIVNETLWDIEDEIRECERLRDFGDNFVQLARRVYFTNDKRSELKRAINELLGSNLVEEKSYSDYSPSD